MNSFVGLGMDFSSVGGCFASVELLSVMELKFYFNSER